MDNNFGSLQRRHDLQAGIDRALAWERSVKRGPILKRLPLLNYLAGRAVNKWNNRMSTELSLPYEPSLPVGTASASQTVVAPVKAIPSFSIPEEVGMGHEWGNNEFLGS
jgi:hypothetical protein